MSICAWTVTSMYACHMATYFLKVEVSGMYTMNFHPPPFQKGGLESLYNNPHLMLHAWKTATPICRNPVTASNIWFNKIATIALGVLGQLWEVAHKLQEKIGLFTVATAFLATLSKTMISDPDTRGLQIQLATQKLHSTKIMHSIPFTNACRSCIMFSSTEVKPFHFATFLLFEDY